MQSGMLRSSNTCTLALYDYPDVLPHLKGCSLRAQGVCIHAFELESTYFAQFGADGPLDLELEFSGPIHAAAVRPGNLGFLAEVCNNTLKIHLTHPANLCVEVDAHKPFMIYIDDTRIPEPALSGEIIRFQAGKLYDVGELKIRSGQSIVIDAGAIVRGCIRADHESDIAIAGRGILDGGYSFAAPGERKKLAQLEACRNVKIDGITMIRPASWMLALADCDHVEVSRLRQIGEVGCSDGIDIVGSRHIRIHDCILKNNDDCIAVKAIAGGDYGFLRCDPINDVFDVVVERCALWEKNGNVMEIGFETRCKSIHDITFRNIDVMGGHGPGGIFTIHNGDRAEIRDVLYEDIRVEHLWDRMIDIRVMCSRYSKDVERGRIRNITFRRIRTIKDNFNTINVAGGYDANHLVENIVIEDFQMGGKLMKSEDDLAMVTRRAFGLQFV